MTKNRGSSSFTLIVTFVCLSLVGLSLLPLLPVKLVPSQSLPSLTVSFTMAGNSSRVVEMEATSKLESMLSRVNGVKNIRSVSDNGSGKVTLELDKYADIDAVRFEVSTIVRQTWPQLPEGVSYPKITTRHSDSKSLRPFMTYTLNAASNSIDIQNYAEENIKPMLSQLKGMNMVEATGATPMEWQLVYDNKTLNRFGVTLNDIQTAINNHLGKTFIGTCYLIEPNGESKSVRVVKTSTEKDETLNLHEMFLEIPDGTLLTLDKLVKVERVEASPTSYYRINGLNSVYLNLTAEESANQLALGKQVKKLMGQIEERMPSGYEVHLLYDTTEQIDKELDTIYFRSGLTILILLLFVAVITFNLRYLLLIVLSLIANLFVAVIFYYVFGVEMQLYSLAGITISLNLVIDNTIVMTDHILHRHNLKAFMSILAATLTTIGALAIIFFLDEKMQLNLQDFAMVVIINMTISLLIALFLVPSLIDKMGLHKKNRGNLGMRKKRLAVLFSHLYLSLVGYLCRYRAFACLLLLLSFGLPVFMLPESVEGDSYWSRLYNKTFNNLTYRDDVKPIVDKVLGGSLRLFADKVSDGSYIERKEGEKVLSVYANLPNGCTLEQMNALVTKMEAYLTGFDGIKQFQTTIYDARRAGIEIFFKKEHQKDELPYLLKNDIIAKALILGGGSWDVFGLEDKGFSNDVRDNAGNFRVKMYGYNYDELSQWADCLKARLLEHPRIKEVSVNSEFSLWKDDYSEFYLDVDKERLAIEGIPATKLFSTLRSVLGRDVLGGMIAYQDRSERIKLTSRQSGEYDVWALMQIPVCMNGQNYKLSDFVSIQKEVSSKKIAKENQQYCLCLQYEYVGSSGHGHKLLKKDLESFNELLPMGYMAVEESGYWSWSKKDSKQYLLLVVVIIIVFFLTSILFNSLKQPLAILFVIPISFIGVFLTFSLFDLNFDYGGFASFVLLCGITVNASIYILNEYNALRRRHPSLSSHRLYVKAWNVKVFPIFLTVVSTILGFVPFMIGEGMEEFWFSLAAGTIGGLIMSIVGVFLYLPIFTLKPRDTHHVSLTDGHAPSKFQGDN